METILIVRCADAELARLEQELRESGLDTVVCASADAALGAVQEGDVDLAVLDVALPEGGGLEALRRLRKRHTRLELPIIALAAADHGQNIVELLTAGANDCVAKQIGRAHV